MPRAEWKPHCFSASIEGCRAANLRCLKKGLTTSLPWLSCEMVRTCIFPPCSTASLSSTGISITHGPHHVAHRRSEEHTSELQSLMRISYAVFCLKKKKQTKQQRASTYMTKNHNEQKY